MDLKISKPGPDQADSAKPSRFRFHYRSAPALVLLAGLALGGLAWVEERRIEEPRPYAGQMKDATELSRRAMAHLKDVSREKGFAIDPINDPSAGGLIGVKSSPLTSVNGHIEAKQAAGNPHFAALMVHWLRLAGVGPGDTVAVAGSGSFPGLTVSLYAALEVLQVEGIVVTSVASSSWGANRPDFTWLDMERYLYQADILQTRSSAASIGGGGDVGRGLDRAGRQAALKAMARNGIEPIQATDLASSVERRLSLYALRGSKPVAAYVNIGGGAASLGDHGQSDWSPGLHRPDRAIPLTSSSGVTARMLGRGTPVIHLQDVRTLARKYELPETSSTLAIGPLYRPSRPDSKAAFAVLVLLSALITFLSRQERRRNSLDQRAAQLDIEETTAESAPKNEPEPSLPLVPKSTSALGLWLGPALALAALVSPPAQAADLEIPGAESVALKTGASTRTYFATWAGQAVEIPLVGPGVVEILGRSLTAVDAQPVRWSYRIDDGDLYESTLSASRADGVTIVRRPGQKDLEPGKLHRRRVSVGPGRHTLKLKVGKRGDSGAAWRVRMVKDSEHRVRPSHREASWAYRLAVEPAYDSNVLRYSERYIDRFENEQDPGRFRIESLDDVVTRADVRLERRFRGLAGRRAQVHLNASTRSYARNDVKDWHRLELGWRQSLAERSRLDVAVQWIPEFYIRHQRDSDLRGIAVGSDRFQAFAFEKVGLTTTFRKPLGAGWTGRLELQWSENDYLEGFNEFDDEQMRLGLRADHRWSDRWSFAYRYRRTHSDAQGFDEPTETRATSDDSDASFEQDALFGSITFRHPRSEAGDDRFRVELEISARRFTDDRGPAVAPLYAGREDLRWNLGLYYDFPVGDGLTGSAFFKWQQRTADSDISPFDLGREKDFEVYTAGFRLSFRSPT